MSTRISGCGGELPREEFEARRKDLVVIPQSLGLALERLDLGRFFARDTGTEPSSTSAEVKPFKVETERLRDDDEILAPGLEFFAGELAPATADPRAHRRDAHRGLCSRVDP